MDGRLFLSVGSNFESGENVTFKVYVADENRLYEVMNNVFFSSEMETGTVGNPYVFNLAGITGIPLAVSNPGIRFAEVYPNPFDATATLEFRLDEPGKIDARIINGLGKVIQTVLNAEMESGLHIAEVNGELLPPGLYSLVLTYTNDHSRSSILKKMIIK